MEKSKETRKIALMIGKVKADYNYGHQVFQYSLVIVDAAGKVRNCSDSDDFSADFDDLTFRCQVSARTCEGEPYGFSCEYKDIYTLDLRRAERCVKMLRKIEKAGEKFPVHPETFGQFVALLCAALGITGAVQAPEDNRSTWHDETNYKHWKANDIQWLVDRQIADFMTEHGERLASCAA